MSSRFRFYTGPQTLPDVAVFLLKASAAYHGILSYVGWHQGTVGPSMLPTANVRGDVYWISSYYRRGRGIKAGDLISFRHPLVPGESASKRVLGMPGDWIAVDAGNVGGEGRMMKVPEGHCWVEGDHSEWSRDSRIFGPLPLALIRGKLLARIMPFDQKKWIINPFESG